MIGHFPGGTVRVPRGWFSSDRYDTRDLVEIDYRGGVANSCSAMQGVPVVIKTKGGEVLRGYYEVE